MNFKSVKKMVAAMAASALMVCFSIPSFAAQPTVSMSNTKAKTGDTIDITVTMNSGDNLTANITVSGLQYVSDDGPTCNENKIGLETTLFGTTVTYKYRVTAAAGSTYSFSLTNIQEGNAQAGTYTALTDETRTGTAAATTTTTKAPTTTTKAPAGDPEVGDTVDKATDSTTAPKTGDMGAVQLIKSLFR